MKGKKRIAQRLKAYSAVTAGVMAVAAQAEGAVVYSGPQNLTVDQNNSWVTIDLNNDGTNDFAIGFDIDWFYLSYYGNNSHIDYYNNYDPARLPNGYLIGPNLNNTYTYYWDNEGSDTLASTGGDGNFNNAQGYIGVRFQSQNCSGQNYHYGWIRFGANMTTLVGTVYDWAYETNCNTPIAAGDQGQQAQPPVSVPVAGPAGLGALAALLGGAAIRALKKGKKEE